ncbi:histidine ammonia-lyase [uncultured Oscillibacter sp.]|uniref:HAL/PAL/TAL family ammonia-lyase n=1 Tax=uncultured Oscillibacter sp. TaxID=876091 RepID=UPI0025E54551|nr:aromatic amino acid ammonia-lyase [uncultured Oscillibacter sp.]
MEPVVLNGRELTLEALYEIAYHGRVVEIEPEAYQRLEDGRRVMMGLSREGKPIYGLNRGVGWNKDQTVLEEELELENQKILCAHALGFPPYNTDTEVRAMMAIRLNNMLIGASCASDELVNVYRDFLNHGITPRVPQRGSVGEADIVTITHMGMAFIGQGEVSYRGKIVPAKEAIEKEGIAPYRMRLKDAHTMMLSNCQGEAMTAILVHEVEDLVKMSDLIFCLDYEGLNGNIESLREDVNALRGLPGQIECAARCRRYLEGSYLYEPHPDRALQDPLTFRGGFTITGSVVDAVNYVKEYLRIQINSPSDNPCVMPGTDGLYVNSNFETTTLAVGVEMLTIALGHLSRAINYRMIKMSASEFTHLPRYLAPRDGSSHGFAIVQDAFSSLEAENRMLVNPSSVDFFQVEGGIEDHASNLPLVASKAQRLTDNIRRLVGLEAMYAAQAVDLREGIRLGRFTREAYEVIREFIPKTAGLRGVCYDMNGSYELICSGTLLDRVGRS